MNKDYTPAYNTLKNDLEVIKKHLDNISDPTYLEKLRLIKEKIESFDFSELSQKQETYANLKELDDTLIAQRPVLKKLIQSVSTPGKLSETATSLMLIDRFIGRFEGNLSAFLIDLRLDFPEIQEQVDLQDSLGKTLLMYAVCESHEEAIERLLQNGANPFLEDNYGNSAFSLALGEKNEKCAKNFIKLKLDNSKWDQFENKAKEDQEGFFHFIMENICEDGSDLYIQLGLDRDGAIACWGEAKTSYEHSEEG